MFISTSVGVSLVMIVFALLGWGTQTNGLINLDFPASLYHFDFMLWRTFWCFFFCITLGTRFIPPTTDDFWQNLKECWHSGVGFLSDSIKPCRKNPSLAISAVCCLVALLICFSNCSYFLVYLDLVYRVLFLFKSELQLFSALSLL